MEAILNKNLANNYPHMIMFVRIMKLGHNIENHVTAIFKKFEKQFDPYFRFIINDEERYQMLLGLSRIQNHYSE